MGSVPRAPPDAGKDAGFSRCIEGQVRQRSRARTSITGLPRLKQAAEGDAVRVRLEPAAPSGAESKASEGIARTEDSGRSFEERCLLVSS